MSNSQTHFLDLFFHPRSVAVVGASRNPQTANYHLVSNLVNLKFLGKVYPVNPNAGEIMGLKAYPDVRSIEGDIDLAVISVPANLTLDIVRDCVAKKVKGITITAGGFSETGTAGRGIQDEILRLLRPSGIRAIGPNALSPVNARTGFIVGFMPIQKLPPGRVSFIFQSGLYEPRLQWLVSDYHLYLSKLVDLGNKMDVTEVDALEYLAQDTETGVIAIHTESIAGDARKFLQLLQKTTREKPVIILKSGRTPAGARAASSHTGAIIRASDAAFDAAMKQSGAIRVAGLDDFFDLAKVFEYLPLMKKNRIAVATLSGGEGVLTTDYCQLNGLALAEFTPETKQRLHAIFPPWDIPVNPLDTGVCSQFTAGIDVHIAFLQAMADDPNVDGIALSLPVSRLLQAEELTKSTDELIKQGKVVVTWSIDPTEARGAIAHLEANRIPVYPSAERAIRALAALYRYHEMRELMS
jgi:acyl-CoA synthetase (NDP forming)